MLYAPVMKLLTILLIGTCLFAGTYAKADRAISGEDELARLRHDGAKGYVDQLYEDDPRWSFVFSRIRSGQPQWLHLAQAMKPAADGAFAEELQTSIVLALANNPSDVLRMLSPDGGLSTWRLSQGCGGTIPTPGKIWLKKYKWNAIRAVSAVRDAGLAKQKARCLQILRSIDLSGPPEAYE